MKTEHKCTKLSSGIFAFIFFSEAEMDRETLETNTKIDNNGNRYRLNTDTDKKLMITEPRNHIN
jgi:hypothetical protein